MTASIKTTAVFLRPFQLPGFDETLPAGEYEVEIPYPEPQDGVAAGSRTSSVTVWLHARASHPGLSRTLTVPLAELENAVARDQLTGKPLADFFLEEMLADPLIRLVMDADGVSEAQVRDLHGDFHAGRPGHAGNRNGCDATKAGEDHPNTGQYGVITRPGIGE